MVARHRITPHRVMVPAITAVTAQSARRFARHSHDQFGIGVVLMGAQSSASGRGQFWGQFWGQAGDIVTANPGEVLDGIPVDDRGRHWRMLHFDPEVMARLTDHPGEFARARRPHLQGAARRSRPQGVLCGIGADLRRPYWRWGRNWR